MISSTESSLSALKEAINSNSSLEEINAICEETENFIKSLSRFSANTPQETRQQTLMRNKFQETFDGLLNIIDTKEFKSQKNVFIDLDKDLLRQREEQTKVLEVKMKSAKEMMAECAALTKEQGKMIDRIDSDIDIAKESSEKVNIELEKAKKSQKRKKMACLMTVFLALLLFIGIIVVVFVLGNI